jgi:endonuclease/exonuclease/phosphatase family metal-dependent hydrolase
MTVKVRVMSYNIHSSKDDLGALAEVIRAEAPDLVLAQEAPRRFRWRARTAGLARDWGMFVAGGGLWACGNTAFATLRVTVEESWDVRFPLTPGRHLRGAVFVRCMVGRSRFVVVGTHLSLDATERASQALELKSQLAGFEDPVIVCGDFNEDSGGGGWRTLVDGLTDAAHPHDAVGVHTFSCASPRRRIDGVFLDPRCEVTAYRVVDSPEAHRASDHFPVVVDLELP